MKKIKNKNHPPVAKAAMADRGFTLVELLIVISILAIMVAILIGTLNPIALVNRASDSRRKNDLDKIKIAFEAYYADKGIYPMAQGVLLWNVAGNCGKEIGQMKSYLKTLPCDPTKNPYEIVIINNNTFKVIANLQNKKDKDIPPNWYSEGTYPSYHDKKDQVNYGVSSSNILWYDVEGGIDKDCTGLDCLIKIIGGGPCIGTNSCISGGQTLCFVDRCTGNNLGVPLPGIPDTTPQCYVNRCCNGSGCN